MLLLPLAVVVAGAVLLAICRAKKEHKKKETFISTTPLQNFYCFGM